ncbi:hypothetical protein ACPEEZ_02365 [Frigoribacterium sp. 2-23]|uniref:hypothetical protein n=1 Tax=Frigoribacterium sp. 2-23 TaxID=3415006 RepID=UPI003C6FBE43
MTADLRWLTAPETDVAAAMATVRRDSRPRWVPTKRQVLFHVNNCLLLWFVCIVLFTVGVSVDGVHDGVVQPSDARALAVCSALFVVWLGGTYLLYRWSTRPPSPRARLAEWRQTLTALANGVEPQPATSATFISLITPTRQGVRSYPRYVGPGFEFGNLTYRAPRSRRGTDWTYLAVALPAPLPHLIFDATSNDGVRSDLPAGVARGQQLSLEGDFDRSYRVYAPGGYQVEALYVLTPDVMAALIDTAADFNVEIVGDALVFFRRKPADFGRAEPWLSVDAMLTHVAPRVAAKAERYLDARVPGQEEPRVIAKIRAELENPFVPWQPPPPRIGPDGRRLDIRDRRTGPWTIVGAIGWFTALTFLYAVPGIFAFAGFMSIVDGR